MRQLGSRPKRIPGGTGFCPCFDKLYARARPYWARLQVRGKDVNHVCNNSPMDVPRSNRRGSVDSAVCLDDARHSRSAEAAAG